MPEKYFLYQKLHLIHNWLIITAGMLPEMLPEINKTNIFIVKSEKFYDFDLFECGMSDLTKIV